MWDWGFVNMPQSTSWIMYIMLQKNSWNASGKFKLYPEQPPTSSSLLPLSRHFTKSWWPCYSWCSWAEENFRSKVPGLWSPGEKIPNKWEAWKGRRLSKQGKKTLKLPKTSFGRTNTVQNESKRFLSNRENVLQCSTNKANSKSYWPGSNSF